MNEKLFIFPVLRMKSSLLELRDFLPPPLTVSGEREDLGFQMCFSGSLVALLAEAQLGSFVNEF